MNKFATIIGDAIDADSRMPSGIPDDLCGQISDAIFTTLAANLDEKAVLEAGKAMGFYTDVNGSLSAKTKEQLRAAIAAYLTTVASPTSGEGDGNG